MSPSPGVSVATLLRDLGESRALDLELLAGAGGVERRITNPHPQKTGLALSGFDQYLREGRPLVFGVSEVRFLDSLAPGDRVSVLRRVFAHALPCVLLTDNLSGAAEIASESRNRTSLSPKTSGRPSRRY